ncbi:STT3 domain-containing protein [Thermococcus gammatolerans]|uniref:dolichyl-phosphooligosaccharide-protein glycotransferase n=1 Tax=Thermococcus gammatolerans (strain DSM 15229 / JCM 11827 / EJ3) TaxID=593117 RepID=C5A3U6_THEGJ|nr:STT3 domain-containing protein [Thermococcus gammatolerans]ACS32908.1 Oligosaccharyl transferase STT3 subunit [Thermococcus gammatolerans EJ3]
MARKRGRKKGEIERGNKKEKTAALKRLKSPHHLAPALIALIAFLIRVIPYRLKYPIGYDPYFHLAYLQYVTEHGWVNYFPYALGPWGFLINHFHPKGLWGAPYTVYILGKWAGLSVYGAFKLTPPIFGTLTVLALYYTIKRIHSKEAALLSALILALTFGHIFRSMSNYYRGDNYALFWYSLVLLFFSFALFEKNLRRKATFYALGGLAGGLSSAFWSAYYIVLVLPLFVALGISAYYFLRGKDLMDGLLMALSTGIAAVVASLLGRVFGFGMFWVENWQGEKLLKLTGISPGPLQDAYLGLHLLIILPATVLMIALLWVLKSKIPEKARKIGTAGTLTVTVLVFTGLLWRYGNTLEILSAGLSAFGGAATAEMSRPGWWDIKTAYHVLLLFLLLYPLSLRKPKLCDAFALGSALPLLLLPLYWTRFLFLGSFGLALLGGIGGAEFLKLTKNDARPFGILAVAVLLLIGGYHSVKATYEVKPIVDEHWETALKYLEGSSNENDIVLTWWDHGHWVTYFAHRAAVAQGTPSELVSTFYLGKTTKEDLLELGVDYVTVSLDTMLKWGSLKATAGQGNGYVLILLPFGEAYGDTVIFRNGNYQVAVRKNEKTWDVLVNAGGAQFIPNETWIEDKNGVYIANVTGKKAGNAYLYVNFNYGYAVLMDGETFRTPFARLMFTNNYPKDYTLVYTDGGMVKIFRLLHPNVALVREEGILKFENATGNTLRVYGYTDSGKMVFQRAYNVSGMNEFKIPPEVKGVVIRYTYLRDNVILDRGVFRRSDGWD